MIPIRTCLLILVIAFSTTPIYAESDQSEVTESTSDIIITFLALEGMIALNSTWASSSPKSFGAALGIITPFAMEKVFTDNSIGGWSLFIAVESLALYNLSIDEEEKTKTEIFQTNMIAMNVMALAAIAAGLYFSNDDNLTVSYLPNYGGGSLNLSYAF